jgi:hypothetical protein
MTSGINAKGRFGKQDFVYVAADDVYLCPAGEQTTYHYTNEEDGRILRRYWTTACQAHSYAPRAEQSPRMTIETTESSTQERKYGYGTKRQANRSGRDTAQ